MMDCCERPSRRRRCGYRRFRRRFRRCRCRRRRRRRLLLQLRLQTNGVTRDAFATRVTVETVNASREKKMDGEDNGRLQLPQLLLLAIDAKE